MPPASADPVSSDDASRRFPGRSFGRIQKFAGRLVDGTPVYFRQGSPKPKGLQITIRTREPFGVDVIAGRGFLCINSGRCWLIPHIVLNSWLGGKLSQQTVDIFLNVHRETLWAAGCSLLPVSQYGAP